MYQFRYNSRSILQSVSIQIQLYLYSQVCINSDTTLAVFSSMYQSRYNSLELYALYQELTLTVIKQSSYSTNYILGLMMQVKCI